MCERDSSDGGGVYRIGASLVLLAVGEEDTAVKVQTWQPARQPHDTASYLGSFPLHCGPECKTICQYDVRILLYSRLQTLKAWTVQ